MKKIAFVTTIPLSFIFFRGQLRHLNQYFKVYAISSPGKELDDVRVNEGIETRELLMARKISITKDVCSLFLMLITLYRIKPDIVHGNTPKGAMISMIAAFLLRIPSRIYMCHGLRYQGATGLMRRILIFMEKLTCLCATKVICVSQGVYDTLKKDNICKNKLCVVLEGSSNGIDVNYYSKDKVANEVVALRNNWNLKEDDFIFCFIGRLVKDKGINELISAFHILSSHYDQVKLLLIGPDEYDENDLSENVKHILTTNKNIYKVGFQKDIRPFLGVSNTLVLPSYREGFGLVLMEAGAMGVPCIASDIIGCNNVIIEKVNGILIEAKNERSLLHAMELMYKDDTLRNSIQNLTRNSIIDRFEQEHVWNAYLQVYKNETKNYV